MYCDTICACHRKPWYHMHHLSIGLHHSLALEEVGVVMPHPQLPVSKRNWSSWFRLAPLWFVSAWLASWYCLGINSQHSQQYGEGLLKLSILSGIKLTTWGRLAKADQMQWCPTTSAHPFKAAGFNTISSFLMQISASAPLTKAFSLHWSAWPKLVTAAY